MKAAIEHENRLIWVMLLISVVVHVMLGFAASQAESEVKFDVPKRGITTLTVRLVAPAVEEPSEPKPIEPGPVEEGRREQLLPETVLTRDKVSFEPTPYSQEQIKRNELAQDKPRFEPPAPIERMPRELITPPIPFEEIPLEPNSDRTLISEGSSGSENASIEFGNRVEPRYPRELWLRQINGDVELLVTIGQDGSVVAAKMHKSSGYPQFDESALDAVRQWKSRPLRRAQDVIVPISFRIRR